MNRCSDPCAKCVGLPFKLGITAVLQEKIGNSSSGAQQLHVNMECLLGAFNIQRILHLERPLQVVRCEAVGLIAPKLETRKK